MLENILKICKGRRVSNLFNGFKDFRKVGMKKECEYIYWKFLYGFYFKWNESYNEREFMYNSFVSIECGFCIGV